MNDKSIRFGDNATVSNSNMVASERIEQSSIATSAAAAPGDLKSALESLHRATAELCKHLDPTKADEVARDLSQFANEVTSPTPRRKWYELSSEGLKQAANAIGQFGGPVISTVDHILGLLSKGHS